MPKRQEPERDTELVNEYLEEVTYVLETMGFPGAEVHDETLLSQFDVHDYEELAFELGLDEVKPSDSIVSVAIQLRDAA